MDNPDVTQSTDPTTPNVPTMPNAAPPAPAPNAAQPQPDISNLPAGSRVAVPAPSPVVVTPKSNGWLHDFVDNFRDAVAGPSPGKVYQASDGSEYIQHPDSSAGNKWLRIIGTAVRGAAAGAAVGQGPGGVARAGAAGIQAGDQIADKRRQNEQQMSEQVKQANMDRFNSIKLKHDQVAQEFQLQRLKVKATDDDIDFAQKQLDRERQLGSGDLGTYKDEADLAKVKEQHPDFWKSVYQNNIVAVPELNDKGERQGIHVFLRTPGVGSQMVDPGTPIKVFTPGKNPNDPPTLGEVVPTVPMTHDMVDAYNNAAYTKYQKWHADQGEAALKEQQTQTSEAEEEQKRAEASKVPSEINKTNAEAAKARSDAALNGGGAKNSDGSWNPSSLPVSLVERRMDPSQLSKRSKDYHADLQAANQYSIEKYGKPFDIEQAQADYKYSTNPQTQNTLRLINGMAEPGGAIEIAQSEAKALPALDQSTINKVFNATATEFGSKEATNFHTAMLGLADEYSKVMGGGVSSDTGRKQALDILKSSYSRGQLNGAVDVMRRDIAARKQALVGSNAYLMKQYPIFASAAGKPRMQSTDGGKTWQPAP